MEHSFNGCSLILQQQDQLRWTRWLVIVLASIGQCLSQALAANGTDLGTNATTEVEASLGADSSGLLSRKKRFVVFPEGASFSVSLLNSKIMII